LLLSTLCSLLPEWDCREIIARFLKAVKKNRTEESLPLVTTGDLLLKYDTGRECGAGEIPSDGEYQGGEVT